MKTIHQVIYENPRGGTGKSKKLRCWNHVGEYLGQAKLPEKQKNLEYLGNTWENQEYLVNTWEILDHVRKLEGSEERILDGAGKKPVQSWNYGTGMYLS